MDNFLLNNTSIYLGGQCQWDIVLDNVDNELVVSGFQLAPISKNIAYNRKGDIRSLNNNHSDTFKQFCQRLKESFWKDKESPTYYTLDGEDDKKDYIEYDQTLLAGLKRIPYYDIYKKQFCFFQPVWLEHVPDGSYLRFKFTAYPKGNPDSVLGARTLDLCLNDNEFHDKFINYFNNWMKAVKIDEGNDRTMYVDLKEREASISGVSTATGQLNNKINCNYLITNLLMMERPNIEVDYILSTLFRAHNTVTSQLFNFNFCFDLNDIVDTYIYRQLYGEKIYVKCEMFLMNGETHKIIQTYETRTLFTNYNNINKLSYNPFIFLDDMQVLETGLLEQRYSVEPDQTVDYNVLSYLKDNEIEGIKDINKISQNICHWDYNDKLNKNFNLYNGYRYIYDNYDINNIPHKPADDDTIDTIYKYSPLEVLYSNGVSIPSLAREYTYSGELSWAYPKHIFYINSNINVGNVDDIYNNVNETLNKKLYNKGARGIIYENSISIKDANDTWGTNVDLTNTSVNSITCVYIKTNFDDVTANWHVNNADDSIEKIINRFYTTKELIPDDPCLIFCVDGNTGVFFTKNTKYLLLENLIDAAEAAAIGSDSISIKLGEAKDVLKGIKESINKGNDGSFYQFGTEICVGQEVVENDVYYKYYKSDSKVTYLYRTGGKLRPSFITNDSEDSNEYYVCNIQDQTIEPINDWSEKMYEAVLQGDGWRVSIANELRFNVSKDLYDTTPLKDLVKNYLNYVYKLNNNQMAIDEIYNMYFVTFDYEYIYNDEKTQETGRTEATVVYDVTLTLR